MSDETHVRPQTLPQPDVHLVGVLAEIMPSALRRHLSAESTDRVPGSLPEGAWDGTGGDGGSLGEEEQGVA